MHAEGVVVLERLLEFRLSGQHISQLETEFARLDQGLEVVIRLLLAKTAGELLVDFPRLLQVAQIFVATSGQEKRSFRETRVRVLLHEPQVGACGSGPFAAAFQQHPRPLQSLVGELRRGVAIGQLQVHFDGFVGQTGFLVLRGSFEQTHLRKLLIRSQRRRRGKNLRSDLDAAAVFQRHCKLVPRRGTHPRRKARVLLTVSVGRRQFGEPLVCSDVVTEPEFALADHGQSPRFVRFRHVVIENSLVHPRSLLVVAHVEQGLAHFEHHHGPLVRVRVTVDKLVTGAQQLSVLRVGHGDRSHAVPAEERKQLHFRSVATGSFVRKLRPAEHTVVPRLLRVGTRHVLLEAQAVLFRGLSQLACFNQDLAELKLGFVSVRSLRKEFQVLTVLADGLLVVAGILRVPRSLGVMIRESQQRALHQRISTGPVRRRGFAVPVGARPEHPHQVFARPIGIQQIASGFLRFDDFQCGVNRLGVVGEFGQKPTQGFDRSPVVRTRQVDFSEPQENLRLPLAAAEPREELLGFRNAAELREADGDVLNGFLPQVDRVASHQLRVGALHGGQIVHQVDKGADRIRVVRKIVVGPGQLVESHVKVRTLPLVQQLAVRLNCLLVLVRVEVELANPEVHLRYERIFRAFLNQTLAGFQVGVLLALFFVTKSKGVQNFRFERDVRVAPQEITGHRDRLREIRLREGWFLRNFAFFQALQLPVVLLHCRFVVQLSTPHVQLDELEHQRGREFRVRVLFEDLPDLRSGVVHPGARKSVHPNRIRPANACPRLTGCGHQTGKQQEQKQENPPPSLFQNPTPFAPFLPAEFTVG